jgi:hypothetical protein
MKKFILAAAAAAFLIPAIPAVTATPASAQDVTVRLNSDNGHHYGWRHRHHAYHSYASSGCRTITTRTRYHGRLVIKKVRRCY